MCGYATCTCTLPVHRGQIVALMGDTLGDKLPECMPIFVDRLRNEITRLTTVRSLSQIARWAVTIATLGSVLHVHVLDTAWFKGQ